MVMRIEPRRWLEKKLGGGRELSLLQIGKLWAVQLWDYDGTGTCYYESLGEARTIYNSISSYDDWYGITELVVQ
jgi:hypothetical protein